MAENKPQEEQPPAKAKEPYGPGILLVLGAAGIAMAIYCFYDLFIGESGAKWKESGAMTTLYMNWGAMLFGAGGGVYALVLALLRSRKPAAAQKKSVDSGRP